MVLVVSGSTCHGRMSPAAYQIPPCIGLMDWVLSTWIYWFVVVVDWSITADSFQVLGKSVMLHPCCGGTGGGVEK